jgi:hypothetical protein
MLFQVVLMRGEQFQRRAVGFLASLCITPLAFMYQAACMFVVGILPRHMQLIITGRSRRGWLMGLCPKVSVVSVDELNDDEGEYGGSC